VHWTAEGEKGEEGAGEQEDRGGGGKEDAGEQPRQDISLLTTSRYFHSLERSTLL
jgi:hypothetical protein